MTPPSTAALRRVKPEGIVGKCQLILNREHNPPYSAGFKKAVVKAELLAGI